MKKKLFAIVMTLCMVLTLTPYGGAIAWAANTSVNNSSTGTVFTAAPKSGLSLKYSDNQYLTSGATIEVPEGGGDVVQLLIYYNGNEVTNDSAKPKEKSNRDEPLLSNLGVSPDGMQLEFSLTGDATEGDETSIELCYNNDVYMTLNVKVTANTRLYEVGTDGNATDRFFNNSYNFEGYGQSVIMQVAYGTIDSNKTISNIRINNNNTAVCEVAVNQNNKQQIVITAKGNGSATFELTYDLTVSDGQDSSTFYQDETGWFTWISSDVEDNDNDARNVKLQVDNQTFLAGESLSVVTGNTFLGTLTYNGNALTDSDFRLMIDGPSTTIDDDGNTITVTKPTAEILDSNGNIKIDATKATVENYGLQIEHKASTATGTDWVTDWTAYYNFDVTKVPDNYVLQTYSMEQQNDGTFVARGSMGTFDSFKNDGETHYFKLVLTDSDMKRFDYTHFVALDTSTLHVMMDSDGSDGPNDYENVTTDTSKNPFTIEYVATTNKNSNDTIRITYDSSKYTEGADYILKFVGNNDKYINSQARKNEKVSSDFIELRVGAAATRLYAIETNSDVKPDNDGVIAADKINWYGYNISIDYARGRGFSYFGYMNPDGSFTVLDLEENNVDLDGLTKQAYENGSFDLISPESKAIGYEGEIKVTDSTDDTTYTLSYNICTPGMGVYTLSSSTYTLIPGGTINYNDINTNETTKNGTKYKKVYIIINSSGTVDDSLSINGNYSRNLIWFDDDGSGYDRICFTKKQITTKNCNETTTQSCTVIPAYISSDVLSEQWLEIKADLTYTESGDTWTEGWSYGFTFKGNMMYSLGMKKNPYVEAGDVVETDDYWDRVEVNPGSQQGCYFALPTDGDNQFKILDNVTVDSGSSSALKLTDTGNGYYAIEATDNAKMGTTYYLTATVSNVTYKIPVYYEYPMFGLYTDSQLNMDNYISGDVCSYDDIKVKEDTDSEGNKSKTVYLIVYTDADDIYIGFDYPNNSVKSVVKTDGNSGWTTKNDPNDDEESKYAYYPITISEDISDENYNYIDVVYSLQWNDGGSTNSGRISFWFYKESLVANETEYAPEQNELLVCTKNGSTYTPIECFTEDGAESPAQFYVGDSSDRTFYVLVDTDSTLYTGMSTGVLTLQMLDCYQEPTGESEANATTERKLVQKTGEAETTELTFNWTEEGVEKSDTNTYAIWEVTVDADFEGASRVGFQFDNTLATYCNDNYTKFMWILDESYIEPNEELDYLGYVYPCNTNPGDGTSYQNWEDFRTQVGILGESEDEISMTKSLNISKDLSDDENAVYIIHPVGTELHDLTYVEYAYQQGGSGVGRGERAQAGGWFAEKIASDDLTEKFDSDAYDYDTTVGTMAIGNENYEITRLTLKDMNGRDKIYSEFYLTLTDNPTIKSQGWASIVIEKGMNVSVECEDIKDDENIGINDIITISDKYDIIRKAVGYDYQSALDFTDTNTAYVSNAAATVSSEGTGKLLSLAVDIADGYVIENITDGEGNELGYTAERTFGYMPVEGNGREISDPDELFALDWYFGYTACSGEGDDERGVIDVAHCVAANETDYMAGFKCSEIGDETVSDFVEFVKSEKEKAKNGEGTITAVALKAAYTDYTLYFDTENADSLDEIVFHVAKADVADSSAVSAMNGKEVTAQLQSLKDTGMVNNIDTLEESLTLLGYDGYKILTVYDLSEECSTGSDGANSSSGDGGTSSNVQATDGLYNVTIPLNQLEKGSTLSDYQVVYYDDSVHTDDEGNEYVDNTPYVMETTYVEGEGIVFTTGHFSKYAIIYKPSTTDTKTDSGDDLQNLTGDANGDNSVDMLDVLWMNRNLTGWKNYALKRSPADVNYDGYINRADIQLLEQILNVE